MCSIWFIIFQIDINVFHLFICSFYFIYSFIKFEFRVLSSRCLARLLGITDHIEKEMVSDFEIKVKEEKEEKEGKGEGKMGELSRGQMVDSMQAATASHILCDTQPLSSLTAGRPHASPRTQYVWALELLLPKCLSPNLAKRHGAVLAVAEIVLCASLAATVKSTGSILFSGTVLHNIL